MKIIKTIADLKKQVANEKNLGHTVGFVPTMGALHAGHRSLVGKSVDKCDFTVVSIFVNPTQFEPGSDFESYPRTLEADSEICKTCGVDIVFIPSVNEMYTNENLTWVNVEKITNILCGAFRPGHFRGVTTICAKLFNIVNPDKAFFGQKDAQQLAVIKKMVNDLNFPLEIIACPTVREEDGLAMSSRNKYLTSQERKQAALIYASLQFCEVLVSLGETDSKVLRKQMQQLLSKASEIKTEYIEFVNPESFEPVEIIEKKVLVAIAAYIGKARLIDNICLDIKT